MLTDTGQTVVKKSDNVTLTCGKFIIMLHCRPEHGHQPMHGQGHPGGAGVEDKWRHTYPYVPTSYYYNNPAPPRQNPESIGE